MSGQQYGEWVQVSIADGIATIRIDRPKMNPLDSALQVSLGAAAADLSANDEVRGAIIYGGPKVFAAGADIKEMQDLNYADMSVVGSRLQNAFAALAAMPFPTVAAVEGYALGGGCELAMTADFRIASSKAVFGQPEILLGIIPGAGGTQRLARLVGPAKAKDLVFSGRFVPAAEAEEIGLVDRVVEPGTAYEAAKTFLSAFVNGPRLALRAAKEAINRGLDGDLDTGLALETHLFSALFATDDQKIGMGSFVENGPGKAKFTGK